MKASNPFIASYSEAGAHSRDKVKPQKHMAEKDTFGIITNSNERFERERNHMLFNAGEMYDTMKKLNEVMGNYQNKEKLTVESIDIAHLPQLKFTLEMESVRESTGRRSKKRLDSKDNTDRRERPQNKIS